MDLSLILVNWNSSQLLQECLGSVEEYLTGLSYEAVVVDNCSSDQEVKQIKEKLEPRYPWARFVYNSENLGFARANNQALALARGKYLLLLNPDTRFVAGGFRALLQEFEDPKLGLLGCKLLNADMSPQLSCFYFPRPGRVFFTTLLLHKLLPAGLRRRLVFTEADQGESRNPDWVLGAFMVAPQKVMELAHGFDEGIFMYGEDMDLCCRIKELGLEIKYSPRYSVIHYGGHSGRQAWSDSRREVMVHQAVAYFYLKHLGRARLALARGFFCLGALLRLALHGLASLRPGRREREVHEMKTQWAVLLAQFAPVRGTRPLGPEQD